MVDNDVEGTCTSVALLPSLSLESLEMLQALLNRGLSKCLDPDVTARRDSVGCHCMLEIASVHSCSAKEP